MGMSKIGILVLVPIALLGCATDTSYNRNTPIVPVRVVCSQAAQSSAELENIIRNPNLMVIGAWGRNSVPDWNSTFSNLYGNQTAEQRISSAKTVLWTIRTRCPGS